MAVCKTSTFSTAQIIGPAKPEIAGLYIYETWMCPALLTMHHSSPDREYSKWSVVWSGTWRMDRTEGDCSWIWVEWERKGYPFLQGTHHVSRIYQKQVLGLPILHACEHILAHYGHAVPQQKSLLSCSRVSASHGTRVLLGVAQPWLLPSPLPLLGLLGGPLRHHQRTLRDVETVRKTRPLVRGRPEMQGT